MLIISCSSHQNTGTLNNQDGKLVDLTHDFSSDTIYWPTADSFVLEEVFHGKTDKGYFYAANNFCAAEHGGTHIDAPIHFAEGKNTVERITLEQLVGDGIMMDLSVKAQTDPDYRITVDDFRKWEMKNGKIPDGVIVLLNTGYGKFWPDRKKYLGTDETGAGAVKKLHFPGLHPDAANWLVTERNINAIGIDTASIDYGQSTLFESHRTLFKADIPAFENITNLQQLPEKDFTIIALPMKIRDGSGAPLRIIALIK